MHNDAQLIPAKLPQGLHSLSRRLWSRYIRLELQQSFTTPDAHNPHALCIVSVHNTERRMNQLPEESLAKFRNHQTQVRMLGQRLDSLKDLGDKSFSNSRHALPRIPGLDLFY
jgi:hypothetical protein